MRNKKYIGLEKDKFYIVLCNSNLISEDEYMYLQEQLHKNDIKSVVLITDEPNRAMYIQEHIKEIDNKKNN